jgi:uncharacterized membrane protein YbaN (DUF454 family)
MNTTDFSKGLTRTSRQVVKPHWFIKMLALVILLLCVALGLVGLVLPVIPGILFLAFSALITARVFPGLAARLRKYSCLTDYLDSSDRFLQMNTRNKLQYTAWLAVRILVDSSKMVYTGLAWLLAFASAKP